MMKSHEWSDSGTIVEWMTAENGLYVLALVLALFCRLWLLGKAPLSDKEAGLALQSLGIAHRESPSLLGPHPGYLLLTAVSFFLMGSNEFAARIWPALAGILLVLAPILFKRYLGRGPALALAFVLALDPGLNAASRQAGDLMLAVVSVVMAFGFLLKSNQSGLGIFTALALLSGPQAWEGLLGLAIAGTIIYIYHPNIWSRASIIGGPEGEDFRPKWKNGVLWFLVVLVAVGTLFFLVPNGLSAAVGSLVSYIQGWAQPTSTSILAIILALVFYEVLILLVGIWGLFWGLIHREPLDLFLIVWFLISIILCVAYPARQVSDVVWSLLPLSALAVRQAFRLISELRERLVPSLVASVPVVTFLIFIWMMFVSLSVPGTPQEVLQNRWLAFLMAILLLGLAFGLIWWGWSLQVARSGYWLGFAFILAIYTLSAGWNAAGLGERPDLEIWRGDAYFQDADLMVSTIGDVSEWNDRSRWGIDIAIVGLDSPAVKWALRNYSNTENVDVLAVDRSPSLLITADQKEPAVAASYTGQNFTWRQSLAWPLMFPTEWGRWLAVREAPSEKQVIVLWVRSDLFPGTASLNGSANTGR